MTPGQRKKEKELLDAKWCSHGAWKVSLCTVCTPPPKPVEPKVKALSGKKQRILDQILANGGGVQEINCWKKTQYHNRAKAKARAKDIMESVSYSLYPYWCPICGFWHLTSQVKH